MGRDHLSQHVVIEPTDLACRYFDPALMTVPSDPTTLQTAGMALASTTAYADVVKAATDPASWTITRQGEIPVCGSKATGLDATAVNNGGSGLPRRYGEVRMHRRHRYGRHAQHLDHRDPRRSRLLSTITPTSLIEHLTGSRHPWGLASSCEGMGHSWWTCQRPGLPQRSVPVRP